MSQLSTQAESEFNLLCLFVQFRPSEDWMVPTHLREGHHLLSAQFSYSNANVFQKHLHRGSSR